MALKDGGEGKLNSIPGHQLHVEEESKAQTAQGRREKVLGNTTRQAI